MARRPCRRAHACVSALWGVHWGCPGTAGTRTECRCARRAMGLAICVGRPSLAPRFCGLPARVATIQALVRALQQQCSGLLIITHHIGTDIVPGPTFRPAHCQS
eukprot:198570-Chlamydomonas_euryale.AAC.1